MKPAMIMTFALAACVLAGCGGDPTEQVAAADPVGGDRLAEYSSNISNTVDLGADAGLVQRFCANALAAKCPADIIQKLEANGYIAGGTGVDLAGAFAVWMADEKDGNPDLSSSDEDYLWAAYKVALAREPDAGGAQSNLDFIRSPSGDRKTMLRSLLESQEFKALR
jgi:hypothetical protein